MKWGKGKRREDEMKANGLREINGGRGASSVIGAGPQKEKERMVREIWV